VCAGALFVGRNRLCWCCCLLLFSCEKKLTE